jgi:hypothetical protein
MRESFKLNEKKFQNSKLLELKKTEKTYRNQKIQFSQPSETKPEKKASNCESKVSPPQEIF